MQGSIGRGMMPTNFEIIDDTEEHTYSSDSGFCSSIMFWSDTVVFTSLEKNGKALTSAELDVLSAGVMVGLVVPANWTKIVLLSGVILAFTQ